MIWVALAEAAVLIVALVVFGELFRAAMRQYSRERDLLVNQMCNLADRPWAPPPERASYDIPELPDYVSAPEQEPEY